MELVGEDAEASLLQRWKRIEELEHRHRGSPSVDTTFNRLKEEWFLDAFGFLESLPEDLHWWCKHRHVAWQLLEPLCDYFNDLRNDSALKIIWRRMSSQFRGCQNCVIEYYKAKEFYKTSFAEEAVKPLLDVLQALDRERVATQLRQSVRKEKPDSKEDLCVLFEILRFPALLEDSSVSKAFVPFFRYAGNAHALNLPRSQKYPGLYELLCHPNRGVRRIALGLATSLEHFSNAEELKLIRTVLEKHMKFLESKTLEKEPSISSTHESVWIGLQTMLGLLKTPALQESILECYPAFPSILLKNISESSSVFWNALGCLERFLEVLGAGHKLWLRTTVSPDVMCNTLMSECLQAKEEATHKAISDIFQPFLQSLEPLQDGQHERQRSLLLRFLHQVLNSSTGFGFLKSKNSCQIPLRIVTRGYTMYPPSPPWECADLWGPTLISTLRDYQLDSSVRQAAVNLIEIILVADATALGNLYCRGTNSYKGTFSEGICWSPWQFLSARVGTNCETWKCVPLLWKEALEQITVSVLPSSFVKAFVWAVSRLSAFDQDILPLALHWVEPEVRHDRNECINAVKCAAQLNELIGLFKRCAGGFARQIQESHLIVGWAWDPAMAEALLLLLVDPNPGLRGIAKDILQFFTEASDLETALDVLCSTEESLAQLTRGFTYLMQLLLVNPRQLYSCLEHLFHIASKLLEERAGQDARKSFSLKISGLMWPVVAKIISCGKKDIFCSQMLELLHSIFKLIFRTGSYDTRCSIERWRVNRCPIWFDELVSRNDFISAMIHKEGSNVAVKTSLEPGSGPEREQRKVDTMPDVINLDSDDVEDNADAISLTKGIDKELQVESRPCGDVDSNQKMDGQKGMHKLVPWSQHKRPASVGFINELVRDDAPLKKQKLHPEQKLLLNLNADDDKEPVPWSQHKRPASVGFINELVRDDAPLKKQKLHPEQKLLINLNADHDNEQEEIAGQIILSKDKSREQIEFLSSGAYSNDAESKSVHKLPSPWSQRNSPPAAAFSNELFGDDALKKPELHPEHRMVRPEVRGPHKGFSCEQPPPQLIGWYKGILSLDLFSLDGSQPIDYLVEVPMTFTSYDHYLEIFRPLLLEEFKAGLHRAHEALKEPDVENVILISSQRADDFQFGRFLAEAGANAAAEACQQNDLLLLSKNPLGTASESAHAIAKVERQERKRSRNTVLLIRLYLPPNNPRLANTKVLLVSGSRWCITKLMSITSYLREYQALSAMRSFPLLDTILSPVPLHLSSKNKIPGVPKALWKKLREDYNDSQLNAIEAVGNNLKDGHGISLVQGPPGTGKTRTIVGIISALIQCGRYQDEYMQKRSTDEKQCYEVAVERAWQDAEFSRQLPATRKTRVLVCAQSNAAVDELVSRILINGLYNTDGNFYKPDIVRAGNPSFVHPDSMPVHIDTLIERRYDAEVRRPLDDAAHTNKVLRMKLEKIMQQIHALTVQYSRYANESEVAGWENIEHDNSLDSKISNLWQQQKLLSEELMKSESREREIHDCSRGRKRQIRKDILEEAEVVLTTLSGCGGDIYSACMESFDQNNPRAAEFLFDAVIIDEAAQALEPATLIPLQLLKDTHGRCILVGDPKQLPATVLSLSASKMFFECSMFERFQRNRFPVTMLNIQYRMHPEIRKFPSLHFYENQLIDGSSVLDTNRTAGFHKERLFGPYVFFDVPEGRERCGSSLQSLCNSEEVDVAIEIYRSLTQRYPAEVYPGRFGIITPYKQQRSLLKERFTKVVGQHVLAEVEFGTVDGFQGREVDILILSTVRASTTHGADCQAGSSSIGFVADLRRMNVALTRAKFSLWIIGNARTLAINPAWAALLEDARRRHLVITVRKPYSRVFQEGGAYWKHS